MQLEDAHRLREHLRQALRNDPVFSGHPALACGSNRNVDDGPLLHLAVMTGGYLARVIDGAKTVESRFHRTNRPPLRRVAAGDLIAFKQSGGPVTAVAAVREAQYLDLTVVRMSEVRAQWEDYLAAPDDQFWEERSDARWASLFGLEHVRPIPGLRLTKRDRQPWVVYPRRCCA